MRLSKLIPSRYLFRSTSKYSLSKRRRLQEEQQRRQQQEEDCQEHQEIEQVLIDYTEDKRDATLYNVEVVAFGDQSTLVFREERVEEEGETHEIKGEPTSQRQDIELEDIRKYGLATERREDLSIEERDQEELLHLRKVANKNSRKINEDGYSPSFLDRLCYSCKATEDVPEDSNEDAVISEATELNQKKETPKPFDRLVGGHLYKNHKDDRIGICIKDSMSKEGVFISSLQIGSRFKWSTDVSLEGMRILSINGLPCPSDLEETVDMMKEAEGDLKLVAAAIEPPKSVPSLDGVAEHDMQDNDSSADSSTAEDHITAYSDDKITAISALTDEKQADRQSNLDDRSVQGDDSESGHEEITEDCEASMTSTLHYL